MPETGNFVYCMPEKGTKVSLYFATSKESSGRCINCIRMNGLNNPEMQDFNERYFTTNHQKRMFIKPDSIGFMDIKQPDFLQFLLQDDIGINFDSNKNITILAKKAIGLKGNQINIKSPKEISIIRRDMMSPTVINMCNGFDAIGKFGRVKPNGEPYAEFPVMSHSHTRHFDISKQQNAIIASTPVNSGDSKLDNFITGAKVSVAVLRE